ncbi:Methionine adenosyltransferase 2 subunit beta [Modicella reniformis]|uniref:Methionine adenosyltransferase 2 subunit beta n=1 Tax=Modicella reniformis TaxID=1440133 RepID=A0A9P6M8R2_9FUNG|nr:Methionine adenosyltransferase 2 subunit beta [Modicella reniformis]
MRVLVTGASGLLGRAVAAEFRNSGHEVIGVAFSRAGSGLKKLDLEDSEGVTAFVDQEMPDVVVHCAAERRPDAVEANPDKAQNLNVQVPRLLADLTNDRGILLIYISTDYVFDGTTPPYDVRDKANPLNTYGQSKYDGELGVKALNSSAIILRVPILYGPTLYNGESAVNALIDSVKEAKSSMDHYAIRYPTNGNQNAHERCPQSMHIDTDAQFMYINHAIYIVADVARVIKDLSIKVREEKVFISGVLHFSADEKYTKYEMCQVVAEALGASVDHLKPVSTAPTDAVTTRPYNCQLTNRCLIGIGIDTHCVKLSEWMQVWLRKDQE